MKSSLLCGCPDSVFTWPPLDRNAYSCREIQWYEKITAPHELLVNARVRRLHGVNLAAFLSLPFSSRSVRVRPSGQVGIWMVFAAAAAGAAAGAAEVGWLLVNAIDLIAPSANGKRCLFCASLLPSSLSCLLFGWRSHELWAGKERTGKGPLWLDRKNIAPLARKQLSKVTGAAQII